MLLRVLVEESLLTSLCVLESSGVLGSFGVKPFYFQRVKPWPLAETESESDDVEELWVLSAFIGGLFLFLSGMKSTGTAKKKLVPLIIEDLHQMLPCMLWATNCKCERLLPTRSVNCCCLALSVSGGLNNFWMSFSAIKSPWSFNSKSRYYFGFVGTSR